MSPLIPQLCFAAAGAVIGLAVVMTASPAEAQTKRRASGGACNEQTWNSEVRVSKNKCCFVDHFHYGSGDSAQSKEAAMRSAISSWSSFTAWEYGSAYGNFSIAESKKFSCTDNGGSWSCSVEARPCHRG